MIISTSFCPIFDTPPLNVSLLAKVHISYLLFAIRAVSFKLSNSNGFYKTAHLTLYLCHVFKALDAAIFSHLAFTRPLPFFKDVTLIVIRSTLYRHFSVLSLACLASLFRLLLAVQPSMISLAAICDSHGFLFYSRQFFH